MARVAGQQAALSVEVHPGLLRLGNDSREVMNRQIGSMVVLSLAAHFVLLLLAAGLRFSTTVEKPLSSYQVSLVSLPTPVVTEPPPTPSPVEPEHPRVAEPPPRPASRTPDLPQTKSVSPLSLQSRPTVHSPEPMPAPKAVQEPPPKPVTPNPAPIPPMAKLSEQKATPVSAPLPPRPSLNRDFLRGIELPPEVPKLGDLNQSSTRDSQKHAPAHDQQAQKEIQKLLGTLSVPEPLVQPSISQPSLPKEMPTPVKPSPARPVLPEELRKQLQDLQQPPLRQPVLAQPPPKMETAVVPKASLRNPVTAIQAPGSGPGFNRYLLLVQRLISNGWIPPQVDPTVQSFQVIVKFRLYRNGSIEDVTIEQTSGNEYYDLAGKRAVLSARLPEFPAEMPEPYLDAHFSFTVGEQSG